MFLNFAKFTVKYFCWGHFLIKLQVSKPETSLKTDSSTGVFLWILRYFLKKPYLQNTFGWLLLLIRPFQPRFYSFITLFSFFPSFFSFYFWKLQSWEFVHSKQWIWVEKWIFFVLFTRIYPKINMNVIQTTSPRQ